MDFMQILLWPFKWIIELILVGFHSLWTAIGMNPDNGWTWILSLLGLVVVVRSLMIPLMVRQIKSQRNMLMVAPEIKKIQDKYKGKRDQFSMEQMRRETQEVYARTGSSPMAGCWPMLVQMPVLFGLYNVINAAQHQLAGVGVMSAELAASFSSASIFGAPLRATLQTADGNGSVIALVVIMIVLMVGSQFITQRQIMSKNISEATKESPMYRQQQIMLYVLPLVFAVSGIFFPLGLMCYWLISNFWTMGQQWLVVRNMPTPGSEAAKARERRLRAKGKWVDPDEEGDGSAAGKPVSTQRQQPVGRQRAKKQGAKPAAQRSGAEASDASSSSSVADEAAGSGATSAKGSSGNANVAADGTGTRAAAAAPKRPAGGANRGGGRKPKKK